MPANLPGQLELPQRPSPYAETVLSQQGQSPTPGGGISNPAGRALVSPTPPQASPMPAFYNQTPQTPAPPPAAGAYGQQQWPAQPASPAGATYPPQPQGYFPPSGGYGYPQQAAPAPSAPLTPPVVPSAPLTPSVAPGYGVAPQASGGYGQAAPTYAPQPTYAPSPGYPPTYQPNYQQPQAPRRRSALPIIIGSIVGVLVLLLVAVLGVVALRTDFGAGSTSSPQGNHTPQPTAKPTASVVNYFHDPLASNTNSWLVDNTHCFFGGGGYHIKNNYICFAPTGDPGSNYTVSVDVKEVNGSNDYAHGITLRISGSGNTNFYNFGIDTQGEWVFFKDSGGKSTELQGYTANPAIKAGMNISNTLKVVVQGSTFTCFVNGTQVGTVHDSAYTSGKVGLFSDQYEAVFNNLLITQP